MKCVAGKERWLPSLVRPKGPLGNSCRRTAAGGAAVQPEPNTRIRTGKGSVVVEDALNGDNAVPRVSGSSQGEHDGPEEPSSIRQEKDMTRVIFCSSKGYEVTGHACVGGMQLAQLG